MKALLLGAGASFELGFPLVRDLTSELKNVLTPEKLDKFNEGWRYSDEIISFIKNLLDVNSMNYENIIGALEVEFTREQDEKRYQEFNGIRMVLLHVIYYLLYGCQIKKSDDIESTIKDLYGIKKLAEDASVMSIA